MAAVTLSTTKVCPRCGSLALDWSQQITEAHIERGFASISTRCGRCDWLITVSTTAPGGQFTPDTPSGTVPLMEGVTATLDDGDEVVVVPRRHLKVLFSNAELHTRKCNDRTARESEAIEWCAEFFKAQQPSEEDDLHG